MRSDHAQAAHVHHDQIMITTMSIMSTHDHDHDHDHGHDHAHESRDRGHHRDHNFRAVYVQILADAVTSLMAVLALTAGRFLGWSWLDPLMGLVGGAVILNWAWTLLRNAGRVLLDAEPSPGLNETIRRTVESGLRQPHRRSACVASGAGTSRGDADGGNALSTAARRTTKICWRMSQV